jgi:crossover junction endodeoxyribonuclease RuvC
MGYGVVECRGRGGVDVAYVECGVITASARNPRPARLREIGCGLRELLHELRPDAIAMEEAFYGKNVQATLALGEARGVALFVAAEQGLMVTGYPPATVKQAVVGHGRATKEQIAYLVRALLSLRRTPAADAADALAIAICHARSAARAPARLRAGADAPAAATRAEGGARGVAR